MKNFKKTIYSETNEIIPEITPPPFLTNSVTWEIIGTNPCSNNPWEFSNNNTSIRYNIENSTNCGGICDQVQAGEANATIIVGSENTNLVLDFDGIGELEAANFEIIKFYLDNILIADAHAAGGGLGCQMGPVVKNYIVPSPYLLNANSIHSLKITFTTNDTLFHNGAFYEVNLSFTAV